MSGPLVVVGDAFLDVDVDGSSRRLAPDAPVPVVDTERVGLRPGGAGLAALLAARAGAEVVLVTALGTDESAATLRRLLDGVTVVGLPLAGPTMVKTRIRAADRPLLRLDSGSGEAAGGPVAPSVLAALTAAGSVLVADYGRGVAALEVLRSRLARLTAAGVPVVWDPHPKGPEPVAGCRVVTPNASEAYVVTGLDDPADQGRRLCRTWRADAVAVTVGPRGAVLTERTTQQSITLPDPSGLDADRADPDTCGAGDALAVTAADRLRLGAGTRAAVQAGVRAACAFVRAGGVATVTGVSAVGRAPIQLEEVS